MCKAAHPSGGICSSNPRHWGGEWLYYHGDDFVRWFVLFVWFLTLDSSVGHVLPTFRGVTKWATQACTIPPLTTWFVIFHGCIVLSLHHVLCTPPHFGLVLCIPRGCRVFLYPSVRMPCTNSIYSAKVVHHKMQHLSCISISFGNGATYSCDVNDVFSQVHCCHVCLASCCHVVRKHSIWTTQVGRFGVTFSETHSQRR